MKSKIVLLWMRISAVILVGVLMLWKITWTSSTFYREVARRKIYPQDSMETRYPREGENRRWAEERLWVVPKGVGKPKYVTPAQREEYPPSEYEIVSVPA